VRLLRLVAPTIPLQLACVAGSYTGDAALAAKERIGTTNAKVEYLVSGAARSHVDRKR
jgi:hypothetical protein